MHKFMYADENISEKLIQYEKLIFRIQEKD